MLRSSASALIVAALLAATPVFTLADAATPVGVAGAVNPATDSTPPGGQTRTVMVGAQMLMNEKVVTGASGSTQLVFTDHSTLTIGPSSEVVIDEFVYNPADNSGKMAVSLGRGVMRFVGGELSHKDAATIKTPSATVGIRGGIVMIRVTGPETAVINLFGSSTVTSTNCDKSQRCTVSVLRPGFGTTVSSATTPPDAPFQVPGDQVLTLTVQLQSSPTQTGGSSGPPSDSNAQANGTGQTNSGLAAHNVTPQTPQGGGPTPPDPNNQGLGGTPGLYGGTTNVGDITQQQQLAMNAGVEPTNFADGTTSIGDLRRVTAPRTFTYSQTNVPIYYYAGSGLVIGAPQLVGSYNFNMTINLGAPANRSFTATASNINVGGASWPYASFSNGTLSIDAPAPDYKLFGGPPAGDNVIGYGVSTSCAENVGCSFGVGLRNSGGRVAVFADHNVVLFPTVPCEGMDCPGPPPLGTPGTAGGSGSPQRDLGGPITTFAAFGGKKIGRH